MTSNTSTTSTSGVTLIPAMVRARPPVDMVPAISGLRLGLGLALVHGRVRLVGLARGHAHPAATSGRLIAQPGAAAALGLERRQHHVAEGVALLLDVPAALLEDVVGD